MAALATASRRFLCATLFAVVLAAALSVPPLSSRADDIYRYTDANGVIHFSNVGFSAPHHVHRVTVATPHATRTRSGRTHTVQPSMPTFVRNSYSDMIERACARHGVDPALVHALVKVESNFNPRAVSRKGARGLMQLMPETAHEMHVRNSFNPAENIDAGVRYLRSLLDHYEGNIRLALAAYNSGVSAVQRWGTIPPFPETKQYVRKIMNLYHGTGQFFTPRYTVYMRTDAEGDILLTDDPSGRTAAELSRSARNTL